MAAKIQLTYDELVNSYEWKLVQRILKKRFSWIKGIKVDPENVNKYNLIFVTIIYDPYELAKEQNWKIAWYKVGSLRRKERVSDAFLSIIYKVPTEISRAITDEIEEILRSLKKNKVVPEELKLPESRVLQVGDFEPTPNYDIPPDAEKYEQQYGDD